MINKGRKMEITKTTVGWFETAQQQIVERSRTDTSYTFSFCAICVPIMKTYCCAAALLVDKGFSLPVTVLLRTISEFFIKILWYLNSRDEKELKESNHRWEKCAAQKKLKLLNDLLESRDVLSPNELTKLEQKKKETEKELASNSMKGMPNITGKDGLFEQNANVFGAQVSGVLYGQFCSSVHVDTSIMAGLMSYEGSTLVISNDLGESIGDVRNRCLNFAFMFLMIVYKKLGLEIGEIEKDYKKKLSTVEQTLAD